jgi:hypothetical protein
VHPGPKTVSKPCYKDQNGTSRPQDGTTSCYNDQNGTSRPQNSVSIMLQGSKWHIQAPKRCQNQATRIKTVHQRPKTVSTPSYQDQNGASRLKKRCQNRARRIKMVHQGPKMVSKLGYKDQNSASRTQNGVKTVLQGSKRCIEALKRC